MERCVVDTSVLVSKRLDSVLQCRERYVTSVAVLEYLVWAKKSADSAAGARREGYLKLIKMLPLLMEEVGLRLVDDLSIQDVAAATRWVLERGVNPGDALISAAALKLNAVVVTRDKDWERLPEVKSVII
ncbi:MAG: type II toxin-antitoxin system VapC family toxin [Pyrobaculum sp.]